MAWQDASDARRSGSATANEMPPGIEAPTRGRGQGPTQRARDRRPPRPAGQRGKLAHGPSNAAHHTLCVAATLMPEVTSDDADRSALLLALTTEHFVLQSAASTITSES